MDKKVIPWKKASSFLSRVRHFLPPGFLLKVTAHIRPTSYGEVSSTQASNFQRGKTLWDWLQLLIIPVVLAVGGFWLNHIQKSREQETTKQQADLEHKLTRDNQQEILLQAYIDKISELLLKEHLAELKPEYEGVQKIARVRTLTVLRRLDKERKRSLILFLYEAGLINIDCIIDLNRADLSKANLVGNVELLKANLSRAFLFEADLSQAKLMGAKLTGTKLMGAKLRRASMVVTDLSNAELMGADLEGANLLGAILTGANLEGANLKGVRNKNDIMTSDELKRQTKLLKGATMPNGSTHP